MPKQTDWRTPKGAQATAYDFEMLACLRTPNKSEFLQCTMDSARIQTSHHTVLHTDFLRA